MCRNEECTLCIEARTDSAGKGWRMGVRLARLHGHNANAVADGLGARTLAEDSRAIARLLHRWRSKRCAFESVVRLRECAVVRPFDDCAAFDDCASVLFGQPNFRDFGSWPLDFAIGRCGHVVVSVFARERALVATDQVRHADISSAVTMPCVQEGLVGSSALPLP